MCGIVGLIAKNKVGFYSSDTKVFSDMLVINQLRGIDGTGFFYNDKDNGRSHYAKAASTASYFLTHQVASLGLNKVTSKATFVVGHNRAATLGKVNTECTHPFVAGNITLIHNGTLKTYKELSDKAKLDSHAICLSMDQKGIDKTLETIDGAFALVWYNEETKKLHFSRNSQRPLNILETKDYWVLSSEESIAECALKRANVNIISKKEVETETLYTVDMSPELTTFAIEEEKTKFKPFYVAPYNYQAANNYKWPWEHEYTSNTMDEDAEDETAALGIAPSKYDNLHVTGDVIDFWANKVKDASGNMSAIVPCNDKSTFMFQLIGKKIGTGGENIVVHMPHDELRKIDGIKMLTGVVSTTSVKGKKVTYYLKSAWHTNETPPKEVIVCTECNSVAQTPFNKNKGSLFKGEWSCPSCTQEWTEAANKMCSC